MTMKVYLLLIGVIMLFGCSREVITDAKIHYETIEIFVTDNSPSSIVVEFDIGLRSGCESFHSVDFWWEEETCSIEVESSYPNFTGGPCTADYSFHKVSVSLGSLEAGMYIAKINDYFYPFMLRKNLTGTYIDPNYRVYP